MKVNNSKFIKLTIAFGLLLLASACSTHVYVPLPKYQEITVQYTAKNDELNKPRLALLPIEIRVSGDIATVLYPYMNPRVKADLFQLKCKLAKNLSAILRTKDVQVTHDFSSIKDMTYLNKKRTDLIFKVMVDLDFNHTGRDSSTTAGKTSLKTKATINLVTYEPNSGEKTWQKTLPPITSKYNFSYDIGCGGFYSCEDPTYDPTYIHKGAVTGILEIDRLVYEVYKAVALGVESNITQKLIRIRIKESNELKSSKIENR